MVGRRALGAGFILLTATAIAVVTAGCVFWASGSSDVDPDRPAMIVAGRTLTVGQVSPVFDRLLTSRSLVLQDWSAGEARAELERAVDYVWRSLIDEQLLLGEAERRGLTVGEAEVEARIAAVRDGFPELYAMILEQEGLEGLRAKLKLFLVRQAVEREIAAEESRLDGGSPPPDDTVLLERWLTRARSQWPAQILFRPDLTPYLTVPVRGSENR